MLEKFKTKLDENAGIVDVSTTLNMDNRVLALADSGVLQRYSHCFIDLFERVSLETNTAKIEAMLNTLFSNWDAKITNIQ